GVALVLGPPGAGKSRLRHEVTSRIRAEHGAATIWIGRGDPMRAGSAFGVIGPMLRREAGISDDEPLGVKQQKLRARVARHVDAALAKLGERPVFVLGLARPDVEEIFPRLWKQRSPHVVHLHALRKKGARELVRTVLGDAADAATVDRLVELSAGNAFYLEEL